MGGYEKRRGSRHFLVRPSVGGKPKLGLLRKTQRFDPARDLICDSIGQSIEVGSGEGGRKRKDVLGGPPGGPPGGALGGGCALKVNTIEVSQHAS